MLQYYSVILTRVTRFRIILVLRYCVLPCCLSPDNCRHLHMGERYVDQNSKQILRFLFVDLCPNNYEEKYYFGIRVNLLVFLY